MSPTNRLVAIPYEPNPNLAASAKTHQPGPTGQTTAFIQAKRVAIEIEGKQKLFINTGLTASASLFLMWFNPREDEWCVLAKHEEKAFLPTKVLTPPGGYAIKADRGMAIKTARRKMEEETGIRLDTLDLWAPDSTTMPLIDLDYGMPPCAYPNNMEATQASIMGILKGAPPYISDICQQRDNWCFVPAFPQSNSHAHRMAWSQRFSPHGVMASGLYRVREWLVAEGFATPFGYGGPKWASASF